MSVIARLKQFFATDYEEIFEQYRPEFEAMKRAENSLVNLSRGNVEYIDPQVQEQWLEWSTEKRHIDAAM